MFLYQICWNPQEFKSSTFWVIQAIPLYINTFVLMPGRNVCRITFKYKICTQNLKNVIFQQKI